jgi:predicted TIM-barrel fold metal-dependent hydrolase
MADGSVLGIPEIHGIPDSTLRVRQKAKAWPAGTTIISSDSHWLEGDIWVDRFPPHLRDRAPRMVFKDGGWQTFIDGKLVWPPVIEAAAVFCSGLECVPGMTDVAARLEDLDIEGVEKELLFPQRTIAIYMSGDVDIREHFFRAHNEAVAAFCAPARDRLFFVAVPNYWDPSAAAESLQEIKALGASALLVPRNPRKDVDGETILWPSEKMAPFWKAVEDSGLPLCFHIGERVDLAAGGAAGTGFLINTQGFRSTWGDLTFGGVFDRHPALKVVFVEAGMNWVPGMLHDADLAYHSFASMVQPKLAHTPSWYWRQHCYATFMTDPAGLRLLDMIGPETVMWSSDYPHQESTLGYSSSAIQAVFDATDVATAQQIVGKTALKLFNMG